MMRAKILIVDDEPDLLLSLKNRITFLGHDPLTADNKTDALRAIYDEEPDLVLLDLKLTKTTGDTSGLDILKQLHETPHRSPALDKVPPHTPVGYTTPLVVILTAFGTVELAVEAMQQGAFNFITKPFSNSHLDVVIKKALDTVTFSRQFDTLRKEVARQYQPLTSVNKLMNAQLAMAKRAAPTDATILLLGETGTGKEVVARTIHGWSPRANKPFIPVNCAAISETLIESELFGHEKGSFTGATAMKRGQFEQADGGTLFLDEIGDMSLTAQAKVLRALQEKQITRVGGTKLINVDVRVLAATNKDLQQAVRQGTFREDLYHRIAVITLTLPPLRKRMDDLPDLITQFLSQPGALGLNRRCTVSAAALQALQQYSWPGNIRELENMLTRALILSTGDTINLEHLGMTDSVRPSRQESSPDIPLASYHDSVKAFKRKLIEDALRRSGWNQTKTAASFGLQRTYFTRLLRELSISGKPPACSSPLEVPDVIGMNAEPAAETI